MRRFANQVRQVANVYMSTRGSWAWLLSCLFFLGLWIISLEVGRNPDGDELTFRWIFFFLCNTSYAVIVYEQVRQQFLHSRARLLPNFSAPHWTVPIAFCAFAGIIVPACFALFTRAPLLTMCAIASLVLAISLLLTAFPNTYWILIVTYFGSQFLGYDLLQSKFFDHPVACSVLLVVTWAGVLACSYRISTLREDDYAYQRALDATRKVRADGPDGQTQSQFRSFARWSAISDRWHARIGGFHQFQQFRIIRLLRYGIGATPIELTAFASAVVMTIVVGGIVPKTDDSYDLTRSTDYFPLILPALFASIAPVVVAGGAIGLRVPRLKNEILFPLTRRELIDDLLLTSAWHSLLIWLLGCASGMAILLYALPAESKTISLYATAAVLTGATSIAAYGLSLHIVMWERNAAQFVVLGLFVFGIAFLMINWWISRETFGDVPYWIIAFIIGSIGAMITRTARTAWFNLEFGLF
jgi:hypothetical protein